MQDDKVDYYSEEPVDQQDGSQDEQQLEGQQQVHQGHHSNYCFVAKSHLILRYFNNILVY